ncbi:L,D-transpeptidase family protein [Pedobacter sp. BS3]|uniref:L,D-transpeptidase family protein n=1 Tax=Pedobacter sp. BS3 TaxID=2567937 RepID=UPI0011EC941A|nr:L,D-transpeptidase family protein [Pedobacter sp. BS3]TZF82645.1 L,D-transpeptidase family protein [Pedobacter sp. BS3]
MHITRLRHTFFLSIIGLLAVGCGQTVKNAKSALKDSIKTQSIKEWNKTIPGNFSTQTQTIFDSTAIDSFLKQYPEFNACAGEIHKFYNTRKFAYAWFDSKGLLEQAGNLADRVLNLKNEGVNKDIPYKSRFDSLLNEANHQPSKHNIQLELMLTAQYFTFAQIAWQGMDTSVSKSANWYLPRKKISYDLYLDSLLKKPFNKDGASQEPVYRQYELLRGFLSKYRALAEKESWDKIVADKRSYKPGDSSAVISAIKHRLHLLGDYSGNSFDGKYDTLTEKAVAQFQYRHGLPADGAIGSATLAQLNVPLSTRIRQIIVNMERSRWLPVSLNTNYIAINIPEFKLHVYHADSLLWSCNVVVGQSVHKTVVFYGELQYIVFSPYWNVPASIVRNEILPEMRRNPNYIARHRMEITGYTNGLPEVRQKPGPANSLGLVKFLFPNSYNIYLHDTPAKSLFNESSRAFSHGCIRVSEPARLAAFLLKNDPNWDAQKISKAMNSGREQYVTLKNKVPVFIAYFTAFIDRAGLMNFRNDVYDRDDRLAEMLIARQGK